MLPSFVPAALRRILLPILVLAAAASSSAQTQVTFTFAGTANSTGHGYTLNDALNISFVMSTGSTPAGAVNGSQFFWIRDNSTSLFSSVGANGLTGTWNGTDSNSGVTDDEIVVTTSTSPATLAFQSYASSGDLRLFTPDATPVTFILIQGEWTGLSLPNSSIGDPVTYFAARTGTYNLVPGSSFGFAYLNLASGSVDFLPATLTISATAIPEPATDALLAGLGVASLALARRRRRAR